MGVQLLETRKEERKNLAQRMKRQRHILFTVGKTFVTFRVFHGRMGFLEQYPGARTIVDVLSCIQTGVGLIHQEKNWT